MRAGAVQLNSTDDVDRNLATADRLVREAAGRGAELVVLPEKWSVLGTGSRWRRGASRSTARAITWARGSPASSGSTCSPARSSSASPASEKSANTSVHVGPDGEIRAVYRKIHMFDVEVDGVAYAESRDEQPGDEVVVSELADGARLGMSICYDVRFPELYRILTVRGARGDRRAERVHAGHDPRPLGGAAPGSRDREPVLRGRGQSDRRRRPGNRSGGRSLIVDPWGLVLATAPDARDRDRRRARLRAQRAIRAAAAGA